jgi:hypothetical protein
VRQWGCGLRGRVMAPPPWWGRGWGEGGCRASICSGVDCALTRGVLGREFVPQPRYFLLLRQKKVSKEKATRRSRPPLRYGFPVLLAQCGRCGTRQPLRASGSNSPRGPLRITLRCSALSTGAHPWWRQQSRSWQRMVFRRVQSARQRIAPHGRSIPNIRCNALRFDCHVQQLGFRGSDSVCRATLTDKLRWSRVGKLLPTQSGGQRAAHPTQIYQAKVIAYPRISPVGHAEHRRSVRGSRRGLFERPQDASSAAAARFEKRRATRSAAQGVTSGSPSLGYLSWRDKKGTVPAGHPRHLNHARQRTKATRAPFSYAAAPPLPNPSPSKGRGAMIGTAASPLCYCPSQARPASQ